MVKNRKTSVVIEETIETPNLDRRYEAALKWFAAARGVLTRLADDCLELRNSVADDDSLDEILDADRLMGAYHAIMEAFDRTTDASPSPSCSVSVSIPSPLPK
ncbi:MAG: hypothetical protein K8U57_20460 [Planctomycetes bacterium]|nr:hypothetical protein [Planctomycetota bacterium]